MFVCGKAADAFSALTFPISTSEITIALERAAHFEKQNFIQVAARAECPEAPPERGSVLMKGETDSVI